MKKSEYDILNRLPHYAIPPEKQVEYNRVGNRVYAIERLADDLRVGFDTLATACGLWDPE